MRVLNLRSCALNPDKLSVETLSGNRTVQKVPSRALCVFRRKDVEEENGVLSFFAMQFFPSVVRCFWLTGLFPPQRREIPPHCGSPVTLRRTSPPGAWKTRSPFDPWAAKTSLQLKCRGPSLHLQLTCSCRTGLRARCVRGRSSFFFPCGSKNRSSGSLEHQLPHLRKSGLAPGTPASTRLPATPPAKLDPRAFWLGILSCFGSCKGTGTRHVAFLPLY